MYINHSLIREVEPYGDVHKKRDFTFLSHGTD